MTMDSHHNNVANAVAEHLATIKAKASGNATVAPAISHLRQLILHAAGKDELTFLEPPEIFDAFIIGSIETASGVVAVYNKMAVVAALCEAKDMTPEEAVDALASGVAASVSEGRQDSMPLFMVDIRDHAV